MIISALHQIISAVFGGIAWVINQFYSMILLLANIDIFEQFADLKNKIFMLMGLFMIFKLAFSVIQYVVDPDKLTDHSGGFQKILVKVVVVLALLGSVDVIFDEAIRIQNIILTDGVLEKLIFNKESAPLSAELDEEGLSEDRNGRYLSFAIFAPFIKYNIKSVDDEVDVCESSPYMQAVEGGADAAVTPTGECYDLIKEMIPHGNVEKFEDAIKELKLGRALFYSVNTKRQKENAFDIDWFIGPIVGVICVVLLAIICVNVAIRTLKLSFLRLIAPIPIISYIDPKDKEGMFKKWLKLTIKTYLDLFIRLISFYFAILIITEIIAKNHLGDYTFADYPLLYVFFIIGTLLFAAQLPKLITDLTGANTEGIAKGIKKGGGILGAAGLGLIGGAATGFAAGIYKGVTDKEGGLRTGLRAAGSTFTGGVMGSLRSGIVGYKGGNVFTNAGTAITKTSIARNANWARTEDGRRVRTPIISPIVNSFSTMAGLKTTTVGQSRLKADKKAAEEEVRYGQYTLQDEMTMRNEAFTTKSNATNEINRLNAKLNQLFDKFDNENNDLGNYKLQLNGKDIKLRNLSAADFNAAYRASLQRLGSANLDQSTFDSMKAKLDAFKSAYDSNYRTTASDLNSRISSARTVEARALADMQKHDKNIAYSREFIQNATKRADTANKTIENLNKANGK